MRRLSGWSEMSFSDLLAAMFRNWLVVVLGFLCTIGCALLVTQPQVEYLSRTEVVFMAPSSLIYPNSLQTRSEDLIITAGAVAKRINGADRPLKFASTDVNLVGIPPTGSDYWIRLPDTGGQWAPNFPDQLLLVDAMGTTPAEVQASRTRAIRLIRSQLEALQREQGVDPVNDITIKVAPETAVIQPIQGSRIRALGGTFALGAMATLAAVFFVELRRSRRRTTAYMFGQPIP